MVQPSKHWSYHQDTESLIPITVFHWTHWIIGLTLSRGGQDGPPSPLITQHDVSHCAVLLADVTELAVSVLLQDVLSCLML